MIVTAALLLFRNESPKELLFVRPFGKDYYIFPGGKQELRETIEEALVRELKEELDCGLADIQKLGKVTGAVPSGEPMDMHLYSAKLTKQPRPSSEIEELKWFSKQQVLGQSESMTPMTLDHVMPFLSQQKIW